LWSPPTSVGQLLPYPARATALVRAFFSPWQGIGLGQPGPTSMALLFLGAFPLATLGAVALAQKVLIAALGAIAFFGSYRMLGGLADRPARVVCGLVYLLGPVGYVGVRAGALGALAFGAVAPFTLGALLRTMGLAGHPSPGGGRAVARIALGGAVAGAFVPGSLLLWAGVAVVLLALRVGIGPRAGAARGLSLCLAGITAAVVLLLPWSATWLEPDGALEVLLGSGTARAAQAFAGHGMARVLLGRAPGGPALSGAGVALLAVVALALSGGTRRRAALALAAVAVASGWLTSAIAAGLVAPVVASPVEAGVLPALAFAGLAGLGVAGFRLDLVRRRLGLVHAAVLAALVAAAGLVSAGLAPALWRGEWEPGVAARAADPDVTAQVASLLSAESEQIGQFRALWVGTGWGLLSATSGEPATHAVTGPGGRDLGDLFERPGGDATAQLERSVASIETGATDVGGHLLGAFNIRYVIVRRGPGASRWLGQRDLATLRSEPEYLLLENRAALARAALYDRLPSTVEALATPGAPAGAQDPSAERARVVARSASRYAGDDASGPGDLWLAESFDDRWVAVADGHRLARADGGWANAWTVPDASAADLSIAFDRGGGAVAVLAGVALAWVVAVGAAVAPERGARAAG
jgi:hypothetical protein